MQMANLQLVNLAIDKFIDFKKLCSLLQQAKISSGANFLISKVKISTF